MSSSTAKQKLFSIIIATHNCGQKIEDTLNSIFAQDTDFFEVIVLDNASIDDTLDRIKKYDDKIIFRSEKDNGVYFAFNKGIDIATGTYVYFIGAGDCLKPGALKKVKEFLPPVNVPAFIYGRCYFVQQKVENGKEFTGELFARDNLCQQGIFYHRDLFTIIGKFETRYKVLADWMLNLRCFLEDNIQKKYIDFVVADYEEGGLSADITRDPVFLKEFPIVIREQFGFYRYLICKAFLKNPYLFNHIYYRRADLIFMYFASRHKALGMVADFLRPLVRFSRSLKSRFSGN